jgi:predicted tellurium resistance membrane protein TerC
MRAFMDVLWVHIFVTFLLLTALEIVLGIDNLVFITIVSNKLPEKQQPTARRLGLGLAVITRLVLLAFAFWLVGLTEPLFHLDRFGVSARDLLLFVGGGFLIYTAAKELWESIIPTDALSIAPGKRFTTVIVKIMLFDMLFSLDSVITAVGVAKEYWVMAAAIIVAVILMIIASDFLSHLIKTYWRIRLLALCFLVLIGIVLMLQSLHLEVAKSYLFVALTFSIFTEIISRLYERAQVKN